VSKWTTLNSEIVHENPWYMVRRDQVTTHAGKELIYDVVEMRHPSVYIVAVNNSGKILLQKDYRYTIDQTLWELPAGHSDGQPAIVAASRELQEEDGLTSHDWALLGRLYQATGIGNLPIDVCLARDVQATGATNLEDGEQIEERQFFTMSEIDTMIQSGEFINATAIGAIYMASVCGLLKGEQ
jgi:8-oxo-dGTP pyrophosphatase MutT (NUDIX family)